MKISVAEAKNRLPELIKAAENGEPVTICRRGTPVVDIVRTKKPSAVRPGCDAPACGRRAPWRVKYNRRFGALHLS